MGTTHGEFEIKPTEQIRIFFSFLKNLILKYKTAFWGIIFVPCVREKIKRTCTFIRDRDLREIGK